MNILAFDTSHGNCSITLLKNKKVVEEFTDHEPSRQSERLFNHIETVLKKHALTYQNINVIGVTIGPGSFTGVRIGIAAARGIQLAANLPALGISTLTCVAWQAKNAIPICTVLDAKREQVYVQSFSETLEPINDPALIAYTDITKFIPTGKFILTGNGSLLVKEHILSEKYQLVNPEATSNATACAWLAVDLLANGNYPTTPTPLYIRMPDAKLPNQKKTKYT